MDTVPTSSVADAVRVDSRPGMLWAVPALAAVALLLSLYLSSSAAPTAQPVGCSASAGCRDVLNSRWSRWLGIPVSNLAAVVYGSMILASLMLGRVDGGSRRRFAAMAIVGTSVLAAVSAVWFLGLQALAVKSLCPYCLAVNCCGLLTGAWVLCVGRRLLRHRDWRATVSAAVAGVALLIAGQWFVPPKSFAIEPAASFQVPGGRFDMLPGHAPTVRSPRTEHYIVMLSDYACPHCRQTHQVLENTLARYGGRIGVIVLPTPLDRKCNAMLVDSAPPEPQDCALNRLALAVWCADPKAFAPMDHWLMDSHQVRLEAEARAHAAELVGSAKLAAAETDPRIDGILRQDAQLFALLKGGKLPQLLFGATHLIGELSDSDELEAAIQREWGLSPNPR